MTTVVDVSINSAGAKQGAAEFVSATDRMRGGVDAVNMALGSLGKVGGLLGAALLAIKAVTVAKDFVNAADGVQLLKTRMEAATGSSANAAIAMDMIKEAAERARVSTKALAGAFTDGARTLSEKGFSTGQAVQSFELMAKVLRESGLSGAEAQQGMEAFARAVSNGRIEGRRLLDLFQQAPDLARMMQSALGMTTREIVKMAEYGKISGATIASVLTMNANTINEKFKQVPRTVGEAFEELTRRVTGLSTGAFIESGLNKPMIVVIDTVKEFVGVWADMNKQVMAFVRSTGAVDALTETIKTLAGAAKSLWQEIKQASDYWEGFRLRIVQSDWFNAIKEMIDGAKSQISGFLEWAKATAAGSTDAARAQSKAAIDEMSALSTAWMGVADDQATSSANTIQGLFKASTEAAAAYLRETREMGKASNAAASSDGVVQGAKAWSEVTKLVEATKTAVKGVVLEESHFHEMTKKLLEAEQKRADVIRYQIAGNMEGARLAQEDLEVRSKITTEIEKAEPALARQIEARIRLTSELQKQKTLAEETRKNGEEFARTVVDGFLSGAKAGDSMTTSFRKVVASLVEMIAKMMILDPLIKGFGRSFQSTFPNFNSDTFDTAINGSGSGSIFGSDLLQGLGSFAFASGGVFDQPVAISSGGRRGVMGEAGPEAIMPLTRGPDGSLGVRTSGGSASGGDTSITINIQGDATDATVDKLRSAIRTEIAAAAPGIVNASVNRVAATNRSNPNFLRR